MSSFGETLRREREKRKVSLDDVANSTKISTRNLKALEDENFSILPGGIFNKGFVRAYARALGMNEDRAVAEYESAAQDQPVSVAKIAEQSAIAKANRLALQQQNESPSYGGLLRLTVMVALIAALAFGGYRLFHSGALRALKRPTLHRQTTQASTPATPQAPLAAAPVQQTKVIPALPQSEPPKSQPVATIASAPAVTTPATPLVAPAAPVNSALAAPEFTVGIKTSEQCWLVVTTDGKRAFQRLFQANEEQNVTARTTVKILIGNPGGTEISLNGKPLAITGSLSHPRTVTVGAAGIVDE